ncbi:hypothetical protein KL86PLE_30147 [uncultured Pleomorphomonas sp.]|uniref:Uncharacterized protein n=1 Tax=uncultured Pleomorphomonas sp. TaxID=442121 RepID=A0A212LDW9_9HYPH|nr:hypothetical protein KL86PLE_30147 [uncultured Pleomorphomonas sp.]
MATRRPKAADRYREGRNDTTHLIFIADPCDIAGHRSLVFSRLREDAGRSPHSLTKS